MDGGSVILGRPYANSGISDYKFFNYLLKGHGVPHDVVVCVSKKVSVEGKAKTFFLILRVLDQECKLEAFLIEFRSMFEFFIIIFCVYIQIRELI